jgi:hypothetical protein
MLKTDIIAYYTNAKGERVNITEILSEVKQIDGNRGICYTRLLNDGQIIYEWISFEKWQVAKNWRSGYQVDGFPQLTYIREVYFSPSPWPGIISTTC